MDYEVGQDNCDSEEDLVEECIDYECQPVNENSQTDKDNKKYSFVWNYFRILKLEGKSCAECSLCKSCMSNQVSNMARHLECSHNINRKTEVSWKFCYSCISKFMVFKKFRV